MSSCGNSSRVQYRSDDRLDLSGHEFASAPQRVAPGVVEQLLEAVEVGVGVGVDRSVLLNYGLKLARAAILCGMAASARTVRVGLIGGQESVDDRCQMGTSRLHRPRWSMAKCWATPPPGRCRAHRPPRDRVRTAGAR
jgi:hypothetical protein